MQLKPVVHVIVARRDGLANALERALWPDVRVQRWDVVPSLNQVCRDDVVIVDLADLPAATPKEKAAPAGLRIYLVLGNTPVPPDWVAMLAEPPERVRLIRCSNAARLTGFRPVVAAVKEIVQGPTPDDIAALVLGAEPVLVSAQHLVGTLLRRPWDVRRPRDLARHAGMSMGEVKEVIGSIGFMRVEHFVITVRLVAYEELTAKRKVPTVVARALAGIGDTSNWRRQIGRARRNSPLAMVRRAP